MPQLQSPSVSDKNFCSWTKTSKSRWDNQLLFSLFFTIQICFQAISPGLIESDILQANANDDIVSIMPALAAKDVSAAIIYAISVKENVQVGWFTIEDFEPW
jgi:NADP-dependent 3-hydroxy acid dehydrogenase YdfG